jgi:adenylylsulfate kinase
LAPIQTACTDYLEWLRRGALSAQTDDEMTRTRQLAATRRLCAPAVLLTGHPSAGRSTLATHVSAALCDRGVANEILDGDDLRARLSPQLGFSRDGRSQQFAHALVLAELLAAHSVVPLLALVAPFAVDRAIGRRRFATPGWLEVFLDPSLATCIERDGRPLRRPRRLAPPLEPVHLEALAATGDVVAALGYR